MKNSIAKQFAFKISVILIIALIILYIFSFFIVRNIIIEENKKKSESICAIFADIVGFKYSADLDTDPDADICETTEFYGTYLCGWYPIDYAYVYIPDIQNNTIKYITIIGNGNEYGAEILSEYKDKSVEYTPTADELSVWKNEKQFGHRTFNNEFGHEIGTIYNVYNEYGMNLIFGIDTPYEEMMSRTYQAFHFLALIILATIAIVWIAAYYIIAKKISQPVKNISEAMSKYITDGKRQNNLLCISGSDELSEIAMSFNSMQRDIEGYVESIKTLNEERAKSQAETAIASGIQKGMLPKEQILVEGCELFATMQPAREVGGDLYDYLELDSHRTLVVIADVSGKGFSAAMFMLVTLTLIHQFAKLNLPPDAILSRTNDALCEKNVTMLFTTAFIGIFDSDTRQFTYANAGHNAPYIINAKGITALEGAKGTVLGLFDDEKYSTQTIKLHSGDTLFMYTDGVNETVNAGNEFFGTERLESTLLEFEKSGEENPVQYVFDKVKEFAGGAEQFDDITMLALTVKQMTELSLDFDIREFVKIKEAILALPLERSALLNLCLPAEELFVNICSYAFPDGAPEDEKIGFTLSFSDHVEMRFIDGGQRYNPLENVITAEEYDCDKQIGGLGKFISFSLMDDAKYEYRGNKNTLTIKKFFND